MARKFIKSKKKMPLIVICYEGEKKSSEYYYFKNFTERNLRIKFSTGNSTDPKGMLLDLLKYIEKEDIKSEEHCRIFLVLDTDLNKSRIKEINGIRNRCTKNNIELITSAPTFEIWYLMHYRNKNLTFLSSGAIKAEIVKERSGYHETMDMFPVIKNNTTSAINTAKKIEEGLKSSNDNIIDNNPHSSIYKILNAIDEFKTYIGDMHN